MNDLTLYGSSPFDSIRLTDEAGEYWTGRDLMPLMDYSQWVKFAIVIEKARQALAVVQGESVAAHHFPKREIDGGRWGNQAVEDYRLTRFAAYLTAMAGDDTKKAVAEARIYFAVKTREAETAAPAPRKELSRLELIDLAREAEVGRLEAEKRVATLEPAAEAWTELVDTGATLDVGSAAKKLQESGVLMGRTRLYAYLREIGWVFARSTEPKQQAVEAGWVTVDWGKTFTNQATGEEEQGAAKTRITPNGMRRLLKRLAPESGSVAS